MLSPKTKFPIPIITPRLILRPPSLCSHDVQEYYDAITESMNEIKPWLPWAQFYPSIAQIEDYIKECGINWATKENNNIGLPLWIMKKDGNRTIGNIVMWNIDWKIPKFEFGFWLRTSQTKKGYITEAVNALTRYCFLQLGVKRIEIKCEAKNIRAKKVPERLGFKLEKILPNDTKSVSNGKPTDVLLYVRTDLKDLPELDVTWGQKKKGVEHI